MSNLSHKEIEALIMLLTDSDPHTVTLVKQKLKEIGEDSLVNLKRALKTKPNPVQKKLGPILAEMDQMEFEEQFSAYLSESSEINLEDGAFLLAKSQYPKMEISFYRSTLNQMAEDLKKSLGDTQQPLEIIHRFNIFLFEKERFHGNALSYHDPENSYLNRVIDRRKGIPISLSAIYLFLGRRLNLPIFGIGMPIHFILGYEKETQKFLIDPYHKGALLKVQDCVQFLQNSGIPFHSSFLEKVSDQTILARMLRNLQVIYSKTQRQPELNKINHWIETLLQKGPL